MSYDVTYSFVLSLIYKSMIGSDEQTLYKKGENPELDKKFELLKNGNIFAGDAYDDALCDEEAKSLIKVWCKAQRVPQKLKVEDVKTLVNFSERIYTWRRNRKRELTRIRVERARRKLKIAANKGNEAALIKQKSIKKANALRTDKYRNMKRKLRRKTKNC